MSSKRKVTFAEKDDVQVAQALSPCDLHESASDLDVLNDPTGDQVLAGVEVHDTSHGLGHRGLGELSRDVDEDSGGSDDDDDTRGKETDKYNILDTSRIEGQEDATRTYDEGGVKITPFNLEEEEEEGHFDTSGNYVFAKDEEEKDAWLASVNWERESHIAKIQTNSSAKDKSRNTKNMSVNEKVQDISREAELKKVLAILKPGENVPAASKRLGGIKQAKKRTWQQKRKEQKDLAKHQKVGGGGTDVITVSPSNQLALDALIESTDRLMGSGYYSIYSDSYERILSYLDETVKLQSNIVVMAPNTKKKSSVTSPQNCSVAEKISDSDKVAIENPAAATAPYGSMDGEVNWEYRWTEDDSGDVFGPFSSTIMNDWKEGGMFKNGIWVRKAGESSEFYSGARVDFGLYT
eukprot:CFRG1314T1